MNRQALFGLATLLLLGLSATSRADECGVLSDRVTALNDKVSQRVSENTSDINKALNDTLQSALNPQAPDPHNSLYCAEYDLAAAKARLYRMCYQPLGYTKLRGEEKARSFETDAATLAGLYKR